MKNLRITVQQWCARLGERWRELTVKQQRRYVLYCFACYLLLTIVVLVKVFFDTGTSKQGLVIDHIDNPILKLKPSSEDSITITEKK